MSAQPESRVVAAVVRELERHGCIVAKLHGSAYSRKGFPDLLVVVPGGATCYLEVKVPGRTDGPEGNGLSALQAHWIRKLLKQGAVAGVVTSPAEALRLCGLGVRGA